MVHHEGSSTTDHMPGVDVWRFGGTLLEHRHVPRVAEVFSEAFVDEPIMGFILPDRTTRTRRLRALFEQSLALGVGFAYLFGGNDGFATLRPPTEFLRIRRMVVRLAFLPFRIGIMETARVGQALRALERGRDAVGRAPHWYLEYAGVLPRMQERGLGRELLRKRLSVIDASAFPAYVTTARERVRDSYVKHGFYLAYEGRIASHGPTFWTLRWDRQHCGDPQADSTLASLRSMEVPR